MMGIYCDIYVVHKDGTAEDVNRSDSLDLCLKNNAYMIDELEDLLAKEYQPIRKKLKDGKEYDVFPEHTALVLCRMISLLNEHCTNNTKPYGFKDHIETIAYRHEYGKYKDG